MKNKLTKINRVGEKGVTNSGDFYEIIEYNGANDLLIQFEDGTVFKTYYSCVKSGQILHPKKRNRLNETNVNKDGYSMKIIRYGSATDIDVMFENGYVAKNREYDKFKNGTIFNKFSNTVNRIGKTNKNRQGLNMEIIEYNKEKDIVVLFDDGYKRKTTFAMFNEGYVHHPKYPDAKVKNRLGEVSKNNQGLEMKIIEYRLDKDIDVKFLDSGFIVKNASYGNFKKGNIKDYLFPCILGVGYFGEGKYKSIDTDSKADRKDYITWRGMFNRCYDKREQVKFPSYVGCSVCEEWHNFQNFARWYEENVWNEDDVICLDKDILIKGNKIYSPETCVLVTYKINSMFTKREKCRGSYPIGVSYHKANDKYIASCNDGHGNNKSCNNYIGSYNTPIEAFNAYKIFKESYIRQVADEYKSKYPNFPKRLYNAMYNYKVEITD